MPTYEQWQAYFAKQKAEQQEQQEPEQDTYRDGGSVRTRVGTLPMDSIAKANHGGKTGVPLTQAEVRAMMSDPRYQEDPAFRQEVYNRMASATLVDDTDYATPVEEPITRADDPRMVTAMAEHARPFFSDAEIVEAVGNERYSRDAAYRAQVQARIAATNERLVGIRTSVHVASGESHRVMPESESPEA